MKPSTVTIRADIEFALARIAPALRDSWARDVETRFTEWQALPEFAQHQGARKLIAEFFVRALAPTSSHEAFYAARNLVLDYLDADLRGIGDVRSVPDDQWCRLARELPLLFEHRPGES